MNTSSSLIRVLQLLVLLSVSLAAIAPANAQAPAPSADQVQATAALDLLNAGKLKEAAEAYENVLKAYSNTAVAPESQFRLGYIYYLLGDLDKSVAMLKKVVNPPPPPAPQVSPEIQEPGTGLLPQVLSAKAMQMKADDPKRTAAFQEAISQFDAAIKNIRTAKDSRTCCMRARLRNIR